MYIAAAATDHHPVTHEQLREFAAVQDEKHREHDANFGRLQGAAIDPKKRIKKSEFVCSALAFFGTPSRGCLDPAGLFAFGGRIAAVYW